MRERKTDLQDYLSWKFMRNGIPFTKLQKMVTFNNAGAGRSWCVIHALYRESIEMYTGVEINVPLRARGKSLQR